jgi:hypothetical protein
MVDATNTFRGTDPRAGEAPEERVREERKRYTTQLQRRAQAHVTAELGSESGEAETDRQVTMLVQHAMETTGARRVTLLRPIPRGRRWHIATVVEDGCFYYGLVAPESLVLSRYAYGRSRPTVLSMDQPTDPALPKLSELGYKSYLGVPVVVSGQTVALVEAIDVSQPEQIDRYLDALDKAVGAMADRLAFESNTGSFSPNGGSDKGLTESAQLDLVLRPPVDGDDTLEVAPAEWSVINQLDGERPLGAVAASLGMPFPQVSRIVASLLERGLIRYGRENRRRV